MSPPAYIPSIDVKPSSSATIHLLLFISRPGVVDAISGFGLVPRDIITISTSNSNSDPGTSTGLLLPDSSGSPNSILIHLIPHTLPLSSTRISVGLVSKLNWIPSSLAW